MLLSGLSRSSRTARSEQVWAEHEGCKKHAGSAQHTLCTQRSVSGRELKSSSASAIMGGAVCSVVERREKLRAMPSVSVLSFWRALPRVISRVKRRVTLLKRARAPGNQSKCKCRRKSIGRLASEAMR